MVLFVLSAIKNYLKKYYAEGKTILLDRYTTSSFIYQTLKCRNEDEKKDMIAKMKAYEYYNLGIGEPDLVVFFNGDFVATLNGIKEIVT